MNPQFLSYVEILLKWQKSINLISPNTISEIETRHINDSAQLIKFIPPETKTIIDLGSGAGLPGIILAIETGLPVYLIESDRKKCTFMQEASRVLQVNTQVINHRIETAVLPQIAEPVLITARALADLKKLLGLVNSFVENNNIAAYKLLLPKGRNVDAEIKEAKAEWGFEYEVKPSETDPAAMILIIGKLTNK